MYSKLIFDFEEKNSQDFMQDNKIGNKNLNRLSRNLIKRICSKIYVDFKFYL
jgi:hypothetical protein